MTSDPASPRAAGERAPLGEADLMRLRDVGVGWCTETEFTQMLAALDQARAETLHWMANVEAATYKGMEAEAERDQARDEVEVVRRERDLELRTRVEATRRAASLERALVELHDSTYAYFYGELGSPHPWRDPTVRKARALEALKAAEALLREAREGEGTDGAD